MKTDLKSLRAKGVGQLLFESATHFAVYVRNHGTYTNEVRTKDMAAYSTYCGLGTKPSCSGDFPAHYVGIFVGELPATHFSVLSL
jgi:hypothetical protein